MNIYNKIYKPSDFIYKGSTHAIQTIYGSYTSLNIFMNDTLILYTSEHISKEYPDNLETYLNRLFKDTRYLKMESKIIIHKITIHKQVVFNDPFNGKKYFDTSLFPCTVECKYCSTSAQSTKEAQLTEVKGYPFSSQCYCSVIEEDQLLEYLLYLDL